MRLTHNVTFDVELHDGRNFSVNLQITGFEYWNWVNWYIEEDSTISRYLERLGVDFYKNLSWKCSYRKPQFKFN